MSNILISIFLGIGVGAWVYAKVAHNHMSGKDGVIVGGAAAFFGFLIMLFTLDTFFG